MIAEDSSSIRQLVEFTLKSAKYGVLSYEDGDSAAAAVAKEKIDLLITDLNMPGKNGIELIQSVRAGSLNKTIPILMLTTESDPEKKAAGKAAGATGWITKPFNGQKLLMTVQKLLR